MEYIQAPKTRKKAEQQLEIVDQQAQNQITEQPSRAQAQDGYELPSGNRMTGLQVKPVKEKKPRKPLTEKQKETLEKGRKALAEKKKADLQRTQEMREGYIIERAEQLKKRQEKMKKEMYLESDDDSVEEIEVKMKPKKKETKKKKVIYIDESDSSDDEPVIVKKPKQPRQPKQEPQQQPQQQRREIIFY